MSPKAKRTTSRTKRRTTGRKSARRTSTTSRATRRTTIHRAPVGRPRSATPKMPFSLILEPGELMILRKMAKRENTSVASVIRSALHSTIFKNHPDLARHAIEGEVDAFLDNVGRKLPSGGAKGQKRSRLRNQLVTGLLGSRSRGRKKS